MKTRSEPDGRHYTAADYEAAKAEPVILASQAADAVAGAALRVAGPRRARPAALRRAPSARRSTPAATQVITTLDYPMQRIVEKWVVRGRDHPQRQEPGRRSSRRARSRAASGRWIKDLRGHNIHNAAAGVIDYRTGEVLAYAGSASYTAKGNKKFQPQFDVLGDGWRQPGSSIKPLVYLIGIDDKTMTASTMFMDVVTNFAPPGQAVHARPRRTASSAVRSGCAARSSSRSTSRRSRPASSTASSTSSQRTKDFGLRIPANAVRGRLREHRHARGPPDRHDQRLRGDRERRRAHAAPHDPQGPRGPTASRSGRSRASRLAGKRVVSSQAAYIITDILAGNTIRRASTRSGASGGSRTASTSTKVRPAAYKTGTTSDNRDVLAYGYLAPPSDQDAAGPRRGRLDGQLRQLAQRRQALARHVGAAVVRDPVRGLQGHADRGLQPRQAQGPRHRDGRRVHRACSPGRTTRKTVNELFLPGTAPTQRRPTSPSPWTSTRPAACSGRRAASGPMVTRSFIDFSKVEAGFPAWQKADTAWQARAARGPGVAGGPEGHADRLLLRRRRSTRSGATLGRRVRPDARSARSAGRRRRPSCISFDPLSPCPSIAAARRSPDPGARADADPATARASRKPTPRPDGRRRAPAGRRA